MSEGKTGLTAEPSVFEGVVFDPYGHTMLFEDRRHYPSTGGEQFTRWRDVAATRLTRAEVFHPDTPHEAGA
jgi:hypothetical protein